MGLQTAFDGISQIVERLESSGRAVSDVEITTSGVGADTLHARIDVPVSLCEATSGGRQPDLSLEAATLTDDGGLQVEFSPSAIFQLPSTTAATISSSEQAVCVTDDGTLLVTIELTIGTTDDTGQNTEADDRQLTGTSADRQESMPDEAADEVGPLGTSSCSDDTDNQKARRLAAARTEDLPPYEDREYLEELYESCETFIEMSQWIDMDVASETVRRYMIDADIHSPTSYETSAADDVGESSTATETEDTETAEPASKQPPSTVDDQGAMYPDDQLVADGIGLPEGIQIEDVAEAVVESGTVFQVKRRLGLELQPTRDLLEQLNLLDLVLCRITDAGQQSSYEDVARRIHQCSPSEV